MYPDLNGKVVVITGAAGNLGQAVVRYFAQADAKLALLDLHKENFAKRFGDDLNPDWLTLGVDITQKAQVEQAIQSVVGHFGQVDVLVNLAGGYTAGDTVAEVGEDTWDKMMTLNAKTALLMSQAVVGQLLKQGTGGRIISVGARPGLEGTAKHAAYAASKSAVLRLTESLAAEHKGTGITANAILPSIIDTPPNRNATPNADYAQWVTPESLAGVIGFLASEAARDISGALIPVYGGS